MNTLHQKALELKYEGKSYAEIAKSLDGEFTEGTLKQYFSENGMLYIPYLTYAESINEIRIKESISVLRKSVVKASYALIDGLERALATKNDNLIIKYSTLILDRAGLGLDNLERLLKKDDSKRFKTYAEYKEYCQIMGLSPETGLRVGSYHAEGSLDV